MALASNGIMAEQQYEYHVEPVFVSPIDLQNEKYKFEDTLNELASEGWVLEDTLAVTSSSLLFFFRRSVDS
jgi:hypothetical protein